MSISFDSFYIMVLLMMQSTVELSVWIGVGG